MDLSSFRERPDLSPISVTELNERIKQTLESHPAFRHVYVRGELSNFVRHSSGHLYFTLKDATGQIRAVMFRSQATGLRFEPKDGMKVLLTGSVSVYGRSGSYQIYAEHMQPDGIGALYLAYEQLKEKLAAEGLFDEEHKRPIPSYPRRIGVVTSPTGAAVRDIIDVTGRRFPLAEIYVYPSLVQGDGAEDNLIEALTFFERSRLCDTVILGRGGGSIEDLWAFNGERLARTVYAMTVPVISAVGHETDFTICDFVADRRAPTPSAAAELATPDIRELKQTLDGVPSRMCTLLEGRLGRDRERLMRHQPSELARLLIERLGRLTDVLAEREKDVRTLTERRLSDASATLSLLAGKADAMSPLSVLRRGYAMATKEGQAVRDAADVAVGDMIDVHLHGGQLHAQVRDVTKGTIVYEGYTNV